MSSEKNDRREFLAETLAAGAVLGVAGLAGGADQPKDNDKEKEKDKDKDKDKEKKGKDEGLPTRELGRTGVRVSLLCLGGWHIGSVRDEKEAIRIMHAALDGGMTFFDNAWDYHDGGSESVMGKALAARGMRRRCFLMTKNCGRDARTVEQHLNDSLRRLQTDSIDLMQFHEINYDNDPDWIIDRGCLGVLLKAKKEGKIRFIGYTGHKDPRIHLSMLPRHTWDTVQMPINVCDHHYRSFARQVVPEANKRGVGCIGMKSLGGGAEGRGRLVTAGVCTAEEGITYALSQPIASLVVGIDSMRVLEQDLRIGRNFRPMNEDTTRKLLAKVRGVAEDGRHERFKSTQFFDGPYHRVQHGLSEKEVSN